MNCPFLVLPYQGSPWRWKILVSGLTQTMPGEGGTCAVIWEGDLPGAAGEAGVGVDRGAGAGAGAGRGCSRAAEFPEASGALTTVTRGVILVIVPAGTPARERSPTEA